MQQFAQTESTFSYFSAARAYFETHGKPIAFYSDKHSVFRVNRAAGATTDGMTQFGRALHDLSIEIICANSSQATVYDYPDGRLVIRHEDVDLPYRTFDKIRKGQPGRHHREQAAGIAARPDPAKPGDA